LNRDSFPIFILQFLLFTRRPPCGTILACFAATLEFKDESTQQGVLTVKTFLCAASALSLVLTAATISVAQSQPARPAPRQAPHAGTSVALIDVSAVFENNTRFKAALEDMRNDIKNYEASVASDKKEAAALNEQLGNFKLGTPEYKKIEGQLVSKAATTQAGMALKRREFLDREAKIYYHAYTEVSELVKDYALRNNVTLVIAYNSNPIDNSNRQSIFSGVNRQIVFQQINDITPIIIQRLNRGTPPATVGAGPQIPRQRR
jgi:Skp family chaperone for outer membrane proteins